MWMRAARSHTSARGYPDVLGSNVYLMLSSPGSQKTAAFGKNSKRRWKGCGRNKRPNDKWIKLFGSCRYDGSTRCTELGIQTTFLLPIHLLRPTK